MSEKKLPLPEDTHPKHLLPHLETPSAPPADLSANMEQPPSYDQACSMQPELLPTPFYMPLQEGKGCALLLLFPCEDTTLVSECFKRNVPNTLLHGGAVLAAIPQIRFLPQTETFAVIIHFGAERTALSWLQNMRSYDPQLTSRWWGLIAENTKATKKPKDYIKYKTISLIILKKNPEFVPSKSHTEEHSKLLNDALNPAKKKHNVNNIISGKTVFGCGDWSSYPAKASDLLMNVSLFLSSEHREAYMKEFIDDPRLKRFNEMTKLSNSFLFTGGFSTGDIWRFQDL